MALSCTVFDKADSISKNTATLKPRGQRSFKVIIKTGTV